MGKGFWRGFEQYISGNWAQSAAISSVMLIVTVGLSTIASAVRNAGSKQPIANVSQEASSASNVSQGTTNGLKSYELDPRSIELAKEGNPSWDTFRKRIWKNEAIYNKSAYSDIQIERMVEGLAPKVNGKSMHLHHVFGKANDMYTVVKLTQPQHTLFHRTFGYHVNKSWNWGSIISLFG